MSSYFEPNTMLSYLAAQNHAANLLSGRPGDLRPEITSHPGVCMWGSVQAPGPVGAGGWSIHLVPVGYTYVLDQNNFLPLYTALLQVPLPPAQEAYASSSNTYPPVPENYRQEMYQRTLQQPGTAQCERHPGRNAQDDDGSPYSCSRYHEEPSLFPYPPGNNIRPQTADPPTRDPESSRSRSDDDETCSCYSRWSSHQEHGVSSPDGDARPSRKRSHDEYAADEIPRQMQERRGTPEGWLGCGCCKSGWYNRDDYLDAGGLNGWVESPSGGESENVEKEPRDSGSESGTFIPEPRVKIEPEE